MTEWMIGLSGTAVARNGDVVVPVRGGIPRGIVARLALDAGEPVSAELLIAELWADPPEAVLSSLRAHISRLRGREWGEVLRGSRDGYLLDVPRASVDLLAYRDGIERAATLAPAARAEAIAAAERSWQGEPFAGLGEHPFVGRERDELWELRADALLELARWRSDHGEHAVAALLADQIVGRFPDREEPLLVRALALARAGRTSDALAAVDGFLRRADERGAVAPSGLLELRQSIVRQDPVVLATGDDLEVGVERIGIPIPLTHFVGRARELDLLARGRAASRLVSLVGPAGVGKTRLAVEAARRTPGSVDEVQWLLDLTLATDSEQVLPLLATVIGAPRYTLDSVAQVLTGRRALLVVDNAEHVLGTVAALVAELLGRCEGLSIVVTSRESLRMPGERIVALGPMTGGDAPDAVQLFLHRVADTLGDGALDPDALDTVTSLCEALEGIPLALELAASRLDVLTVDELLESIRTDRRIPLTASATGRHGSLDNAIRWSLSLLGDDERRLLAELSLFGGQFSHQAVSAVCDLADARALLLSLVRKSLVSATVLDGGARRFVLLDSVRAVARAMLDELGIDADAWYVRHGAWMLDFVERDSPQLVTAGGLAMRARFDISRRDLHLAFGNAVARGDRSTAVRLVGAQAWYWYERGMVPYALGSIRTALALEGPDEPLAEARAAHAATFMSAIVETVGRVSQWVDVLAAAAARADSAAYRMIAATQRAYLDAGAGDAAEAERQLALASAEIAAAPPGAIPEWLAVNELHIRGDALRALGKPAQALACLDEAYVRATALGHGWAMRGTAYTTGKTLLEVGRAGEALGVLLTAAANCVRSGDWQSACAAVNIAGCALVVLERHRLAAEVFAALDQVGPRHDYDPVSSDGGYAVDYRARTRTALTPDEWQAAVETGTTRSFGDTVRAVAAARS
ncbi:BTAD domain-containing putative transcriptional regulator [Herbiconiux sp. KACC 21604]|uniref:AfsR/SARP family transcriptional regulator n=1 Tax=unclassified Herbiconiux TaxID=2618217 RepID=UPI001491A862|nr:BTAD domain-containing putative transcriptional regulator [Herbiconiux sp. SALV-R1]QJU53172.1 hypothetical protein HL652_05710 [Herbiconiux sp. SALV-R1]WPO88119.1 BTAD domain-containing putative transcriptional regulator [Herbiconiux sp. KACC 21604]